MTSPKLTAVILAKNEEKDIERCLRSVQFADEILVIDDQSTDNTKSIAKKLKAVVIEHLIKGDYGAQRNFAMDQVKGDWILFIDADEVVTDKLGQEIRRVLKEENAIQGYFLRRRDFFANQELKYGETSTIRNKGLLRLMKKKSGKWTGRVHEKFGIMGQTATLSSFIDHYPHPTIAEFIEAVNRYSTLRAGELFAHGNTPSTFQLLVFPFTKFIYTYFLKLGVLDGYAGFVYSFMMSFHSFLVRAKLFQYYHLDRT